LTTSINDLSCDEGLCFKPGQEQTEFSILLRDLETCCHDTRQCARKVSFQF
jgi:hypothetical protein